MDLLVFVRLSTLMKRTFAKPEIERIRVLPTVLEDSSSCLAGRHGHKAKGLQHNDSPLATQEASRNQLRRSIKCAY